VITALRLCPLRRGQLIGVQDALSEHAPPRERLAFDQPWQSTATASAAQTSRILSSLRRPKRSTSTATETLSIESRLTQERRVMGSSLGSSRTSLDNPRIVVVHGATTARRKRGMAASRDRTTTGRRPIASSSHHQISPRVGSCLTTLRQPHEMTRGHPIHRPAQVDACRMPHSWHPPPWRGALQLAPRAPHREVWRPECSDGLDAH